jgi:hypothetical protein
MFVNLISAMQRKTMDLVKDALTNFDNTSDEELRAYFIENGLSETEADEWLAKRSFYNSNIVMQDDDGNDVGIFDPHSQAIKPLNEIQE